jgi:hypothetical protein
MPFPMRDAALDVECTTYADGGAPGWVGVGCGGVASGVVAEERAWGWSRSNGRLEELLDSRDDELWLLGLNEVRRVDNFVLSVASSFAAELLARLLFELSFVQERCRSARPKEVSPILFVHSRVLTTSRWSL